MIEASSVVIGAVEGMTRWTRLALDAAGVIIIGIGAVRALSGIPAAMHSGRPFTQVRLDFARYLALALEFQLASDILETAISPGWTQLGQLAAIAAIRTALNFFLTREMKDERAFVDHGDGLLPERDSARRIAVGE